MRTKEEILEKCISEGFPMWQKDEMAFPKSAPYIQVIYNAMEEYAVQFTPVELVEDPGTKKE